MKCHGRAPAAWAPGRGAVSAPGCGRPRGGGLGLGSVARAPCQDTDTALGCSPPHPCRPHLWSGGLQGRLGPSPIASSETRGSRKMCSCLELTEVLLALSLPFSGEDDVDSGHPGQLRTDTLKLQGSSGVGAGFKVSSCFKSCRLNVIGDPPGSRRTSGEGCGGP